MRIILGSGSPYRAALLRRIVPNFTVASPDIDESAHANEAPTTLVRRLAQEKANKVADTIDYSDEPTLIIGSDQIAILDKQPVSIATANATTEVNTGREILNKPGNFEQALIQLQKCSGQSVIYRTACCVHNVASKQQLIFHDDYRLHFKRLSDELIKAYLKAEQPYDCAGAIKSEGLGVALIDRYEGDDPSSLIGLPLIMLINALEQQGHAILKQNNH